MTSRVIWMLRNSWLRIALALSLGLNLLLVGYQMGASAVPGMSSPESRAAALIAELPEGDRAIARKILRAHQDVISARSLEVRASAEKVRQAVRADPFVAQKLGQSFELERARIADQRAAIHSALIEVAGAISGEGREAMSRSLNLR